MIWVAATESRCLRQQLPLRRIRDKGIYFDICIFIARREHGYASTDSPVPFAHARQGQEDRALRASSGSTLRMSCGSSNRRVQIRSSRTSGFWANPSTFS